MTDTDDFDLERFVDAQDRDGNFAAVIDQYFSGDRDPMTTGSGAGERSS